MHRTLHFTDQTNATAQVFATKNYSGEYQQQLAGERPVVSSPSASGDLPPEFFEQFPFASNNEEVKNGIFAKKLTDWQANQAARARNPEVYDENGHYRAGPAFQRWYDEDYMSLSTNIHHTLNAAGMAWGVGIIPDAINTVYNAAEAATGIGTGSWRDAAFSAFAMIPVIGDAAMASKYGIKLLEHAGPAVKLADRCYQTAVELVRPSSRALRSALEAAGEVRPIGSAAHHIVAGTAAAADEARKILERWGIGINEAVNGVFLPAWRASPNPTGAAVHSTVHSTVHTEEYYKTVTTMLKGATNRVEAIEVLQLIRQRLQAGGLR